jgi:hypothetical protein
MSLDNFQITNHLTTELYKESLVLLDEKQIKPKSLQSGGFTFLGDNEKNILILVNDTENLHLNEKDLSFLTGILTACKLNLADVALCNLQQNEFNALDDLLNFFKPERIIAFDVSPVQLKTKISSEKYAPLLYNKMYFLFGNRLETISNNLEEKKILWGALKIIFGI